MAKTITGELRDLFIKFGGDPTTLKGTETTAELLNAIEQIYHDSGDTLPTVTTDDNGKVLKVVEGEWDKGDAPAELPAVTTDDNGKVLTVAEGSWGKANVPTELPAVTSDDNGKVLTVVEGAWAKAAPSGGNNDFIINYTEDNDTYVPDKTFAEIQAAYEAGKNIIAHRYYSNGQANYVYNLQQLTTAGAAFTSMEIGSGVTVYYIFQSSNNTTNHGERSL